jgi:hypothetical protein
MQLLYDHVLARYAQAFDLMACNSSVAKGFDRKMVMTFDQRSGTSAAPSNVYDYGKGASDERWKKEIADPYFHSDRESGIVATHDIVHSYDLCMAQLLRGIAEENLAASVESGRDDRSVLYYKPSPSLGRTSVTPEYIANRELHLPYKLEPVQQYSLTYTAFL